MPFRGPVQHALRRLERWLLSRADSVVSSAGLAARVRAAVPGVRGAELARTSSLESSSSTRSGTTAARRPSSGSGCPPGVASRTARK
jgi:hypothetical protein